MVSCTERHPGRILPCSCWRRRSGHSIYALAFLYRQNCLLGLVLGRNETNITDPYLAKEVLQCNKQLADGITIIADEESVKKWWVALLQGLIEMRVPVANQHQWVTDTTTLTYQSQNYQGETRGSELPWVLPETNNHVLQICLRIHGVRIARHNSILTYIGRNLRHEDFMVYNEPHITTSEGLRKREIVAIMGTLDVMIDAQVAGTVRVN